MDLVTTAAILIISLVLFCIYKAKRNEIPNIPGPTGYPIDGSDAGVYPAMKKLVENEKTVAGNESWLTEPIMRALLQNFIAATFVTTRGMLLSLIQILMAQPEVQQKAQEEVDRVVGHDRSPTLEDRTLMPYTEAVMLETLRYTSHVPTAILHTTSQDVTVGRYTIPSDTVILPNFWAMHHSEKEWKEPFKFVPERFLDENGDIFPDPADHDVRKKFMAFGVGKRSCIGEVFAKSRIFLFFTTHVYLMMCIIYTHLCKHAPYCHPEETFRPFWILGIWSLD